ncbi:MAG: sulfatase-like hydrolase/transferase [Bacteroidales bacterium]|nr:sulfatase-like hydrolase/transferase [Candidatus Colicola caccequi]MCQ2328005.1 sulfatase-like hydrolase/transferase [Paludibacteraceae bacterium]
MSNKFKKYSIVAAIGVLLWGLVICGMRSSFQRYPLSVSFAYFCENPFYNKLGVNPVFYIIKTATVAKNEMPAILNEVSEQEALSYAEKELNFCIADTLSPLTRSVVPTGEMKSKKHVVLILMEGMSRVNLDRVYEGQYVTPFLRNLRDSSIYYSNCFSASVHTNHGIIGSTCGYEPFFGTTMMTTEPPIFTGLPYYLQQEGYHTSCFITSNPQFDNMNSFWCSNHIQRIYSIYDYPQSKAVNNFGVQDDYLFEYGLQAMNELTQTGIPQYALFLTVSHHGPYIVPEQYKNRGADDEERILSFADDALRNFMTQALQTEWGKNTLFILVADHGFTEHSKYEMSLEHHVIPLYFCGVGLSPRRINKVASQIDIYPTVLSMLGIPFDNNSLGIDLTQENRRYAFFVSHEHLGCSDGQHFFCHSIQTGRELLYDISNGENVLDSLPDKAADMRSYARNMTLLNLTGLSKGWAQPITISTKCE